MQQQLNDRGTGQLVTLGALRLGERRNATAIGLINLIYIWPATNPDAESGLSQTALRAVSRLKSDD